MRPFASRRASGLALSWLLLASCHRTVEFHADGKRRAEGTLVFRSEHLTPAEGTREDGAWTWWYPNGERRESGSHVKGRREGEWTQWYQNGQRRSRGSRRYDETTQSSPREGLWTFWHENGEVLARGLFVSGRREGHWDYSREDGSIDAERTGEYHHDERVD